MNQLCCPTREKQKYTLKHIKFLLLCAFGGYFPRLPVLSPAQKKGQDIPLQTAVRKTEDEGNIKMGTSYLTVVKR